jgi:hypothetical protein
MLNQHFHMLNLNIFSHLLQRRQPAAAQGLARAVARRAITGRARWLPGHGRGGGARLAAGARWQAAGAAAREEEG